MNNIGFLQPLIDYPSSIIIDDTSSISYSYKEFYKLILHTSSNLENHLLEKNSIIVIYGYRNSFFTMLLFFACIKNKLIPFIVEAGNLSNIKDLKFNALLSQDSLKFKDYTNVKQYHFEYGNLYTNFHKVIYIGNDNDLVIVSSSGSTSKTPKKILLGKKQTLNNIKSNQQALSISKKDKTLILLPISYSYGLIAQFLSHFFSGAGIIFADKSLGILQLPSLLKKYKITNIFMTPLLSRLLLFYNQNLNFIENNLKFITIGGDKPYKEGIEKLLKVFQCPIFGTYGLAEAGPRVASNKFKLSNNLCLSLGSINPGISVKIINNKKYQKICKTENIGFLLINTPSIYLGYIKGNILQKPKSKMNLKTKDICTYENEKLIILGRDNEYIKHNEKIIWFYDVGKHFYNNSHVLKVKITKNIKDKLDIKIFYRSNIIIEEFKDILFRKYHLKKDLDYSIHLIEFNSSQYK